MATAAAISLNVEDRTERASVPHHDVARLMYYLKSINSTGPERKDPKTLVPKHLTDYANWNRLNSKDIRDLVKWCRRLAPTKSPAKDFTFCDINKEKCGGPGQMSCAFLDVSADLSILAIGRGVIAAGVAEGVGKKCVLFYTPGWLKKNYTDPLQNVSIYHCVHCTGVERTCGCQVEKCDRPWTSRCYILRPHEHRFKCDGCDYEVYVTGVLYLCSLCPNYGLCRRCYEKRRIHDLTHPFEEVKKPGAQRIRLSSRQVSMSPPIPRTISKADSSTAAAAKPPFAKGDLVTLKGLARTDMDGKEATVLNIDMADQKAQIRIDGMEKAFKVKWANIEPAEELEELEEELE